MASITVLQEHHAKGQEISSGARNRGGVNAGWGLLFIAAGAAAWMVVLVGFTEIMARLLGR
jgi:hypothetical protein